MYYFTYYLSLYLVLAISTGNDATVVMAPEVIDEAKCNTMFSSKYPKTKSIN